MYFYTETAFHHMGDMNFLKDLIRESARIGANGIKFQVLLDYDSFISVKHSMYHDIKKGIFTETEWREIFRFTASLNLDIVFMPICSESLSLVQDDNYSISYLDIHSVSFYDKNILDEIKSTNLPIILGVGGRTSTEIDEKLSFFEDQMKVLMVGFQAFPSKIEELKLGKISWLKQKYPKLEIGYADHSSWDSPDAIRSNEWAYFLGARYFEKHITTLPGKERWDWQSALSSEGCSQIVKNLSFIDKSVMSFSDLEFDLIEDKELVYRNRQKIVVAAHWLPKGHVLKESDLELRMIDSTEGEVDISILVSRKLKRSVEKGEKIIHEYLG